MSNVSLTLDAWINPSGTFFSVSECGHYEWASKNGGVVETPGTYFDPVGMLERRGWVHLSGGAIYTRKDVTNSQLDTLYDLATLYKESESYQYERARERIMNFIRNPAPTWAR